MLERIESLPAGIVGFKAAGKVSNEDYERIFEPVLDDARRDGRRIRFLYHFGPDFDGFTLGGAWEDAKLGLQSMRLFDGCAIVSDIRWIRDSTRLMGFLMPCPVRVFGNDEQGNAIDWLQSLPEGAGISHRLVPESGVIVVDVRKPLRAQDFDALALTADAWIEAHHSLRGLVIHAREFPGWENIGAFIRHVRFVRDHHRKIERVALAAHSKLADIGPHLAQHFVEAEIKSFGHDELKTAIAWAAGSSDTSTLASEAPEPSTSRDKPR